MSKSVTVRFNDGTSHVYDDVPDDVSDAQVQERATTDFNKPIEGLGPKPMEGEEPGMGTKVMGAIQTAGQVLAPLAELYAGKKLIYDPLVDAIKNRTGPIAPNQMAQGASQVAQQAGQATGTYGNAPKSPNLRVAPPGNSNAGAQAFDQMARQLSVPQTQAPSMLGRAGQAISQGATRVAGAIAPAMEMAGPLSMLTAPYMMAAQEQNKIRQNPNAPGLENNPYAQVQRGEFQTQGQAGASNQRQAMVNMPYGNVSPQEKALLDARKQQQLDMMMRINAAKRVLGQQ